MKNKQTLLTYLALVMAVLFWGSSFVATKIALQSFPPFCLIFFRFFAASIFFSFILMRTGLPAFTWKTVRALLLLALFQPVLYFSFETIGLQYTSATKASLIIATIPIVVLLLSIFILKERLRLINIIGISISMFGVALLVFGGKSFSASHGILLGDFLILGAVLAASIYTIMTRKLGEIFSPVQITGIQIILGAILFFPAFLFTFPQIEWHTVTGEAFAAVIILTIFATVGAFLCYNYALTKIPAARVAVCINGIPLVTAFWAWIILGERLSMLQLSGGIIVISAVYLANNSPSTDTVMTLSNEKS